MYAALRAGAAGFLLKDMHRDRLYSAIRAVAAGNSIIDPKMTRRLIEEHTPERTMSSLQPPKCLTPREVEVIRHVAAGGDNAEIARQFTLTEATVKTHLNRAMTKLGLKSRAQVVVFAYETGLVTPGNNGSIQNQRACFPTL